MKPDIEIIRSILLNVESDKYRYGELVHLDGIPDDTCAHQVEYIFEAGLAIGQLIRTDAHGVVAATIDRLTIPGHKFCEDIKKDTIWNKVKEHIKKSGSPVMLAAVIELVKIEVHQLFSGGPPHK